MNKRDNNGSNKLKGDEAKKRLALALLARYDIEGAEALAKRDNVPFDRELALQQIEAMLGKEEADAARYRWSPEAEEESFRRSRRAAESGEHFRSKVIKMLQTLPLLVQPAGAAAAHSRRPQSPGNEISSLTWKQGDETYELYYVEPDRNTAYVRCIDAPDAVLGKSSLAIGGKEFALQTEGGRVYTRWPISALFAFFDSRRSDLETDERNAPWIS